MTISMGAAFRVQEKFFRGITSKEEIPEHLHAPGSASGKHLYGAGIGHAIAMLLTGQVQVQVDPQGTLDVQCPSSSGSGTNVALAQTHAGVCHWDGDVDGASGAAILTLVTSLLAARFPHTRAALQHLAGLVGYPVKPALLADLPASNHSVKGALLSLADCVYFEFKEAFDHGHVQRATVTTGAGQPLTESMLRAALLGTPATPQGPASSGKRTPLARLTRLAQRGGAALLVGPPGTFKTETVKQLVLDTGAAVVKVVGSPGIEDRDFIGAITPTAQGARWVDGPLARAFLLARTRRTVFHLDEILRFQPEHLNVLIGAMDTLSHADAVAVLRPALEAQEQPEADIQAFLARELPDQGVRYHLLQLPTGEALFAPAPNLVWAATTNMGDGHLQTAQGLDDALLSRIDLVIDFDRPDPAVALPLYEGIAGRADLARLALAFEDLTVEMA